MKEAIGSIKSELKKRIVGKRVVLCGMGNTERGDDGFGIHLAQRLKGKIKSTPIFDCGTAPENYLGPIVKAEPQVLLMVDAANLGAEPGHTHIIEEDDIASLGLSTHDASLKLFITYLKDSLDGLDIFLLGVQPKDITYGSGMSGELNAHLEKIDSMFKEILS